MELDNKKALHYPSIAQAVGLLGIWLLATIIVTLFSALIPDLDQSYVLLIVYAIPLIAVIYIGAKRKGGIQYRSIKKEPPLIAYLILLAATPALGFIIEPLITLIPISDSWKSMLTFMDDTSGVNESNLAITDKGYHYCICQLFLNPDTAYGQIGITRLV